MENKGVFLNEIPAAGEITLLAAVVDKEIRSKRNGGSYLALRLADRSAELDAKVWDNPEAVAQLFSTSDVVKVRGTVEHYTTRSRNSSSAAFGVVNLTSTTFLTSIQHRAGIRKRCSVNFRHLWP
jgi:DNA polymerase III alpha subunit